MTELEKTELELRRQELALQRDKLFIEFAKFGFSGTLAAAGGGMVLVLALGSLSAFTPFKIEAWELLAMTFCILVGSIAFGFLSLWQLPNIVARFHEKFEFGVRPGGNKN